LGRSNELEVGEINAFERIFTYGPAFHRFEVAVAVRVPKHNANAVLNSFDLKMRLSMAQRDWRAHGAIDFHPRLETDIGIDAIHDLRGGNLLAKRVCFVAKQGRSVIERTPLEISERRKRWASRHVR
jgi:hypothetical protein